jgi:hypothetical protein
MNVSTLEAPATPAASPRPSGLVSAAPTRAPGRPRRRTGPGTGPEARPFRPVPSPTFARGTGVRPQSCTVAAPAPALAGQASRWRLTERGIALVVVTGLLIVTAALAVVGLTALRVTGERYTAAGHSVLAQP